MSADTRRRPLFVAVAFAIPILFFVVLEAGLRLAGQRVTYPLFIASPGQPDYLQASPEVIKRFFADPDAAPAVNIETGYFLADKPRDSLRIVVQGGSSAAGFPYGYGASLAGMLEQRLRRLMPGRHVEVISTAMSAVNSYTLLDFADEIVAQRPNAVMIYAGHNEYLGVLGVGSALSSDLSPALTRATMRLRRYAVYQAVERLIGRSGPQGDALGEQPGRTLMARIARDKAIPYGSQTYEKGVAQFESNLERLVARYRRARIPVIVGTLASNEGGLAPFHGGVTDPAAADAYAAHMTAGREALDAGNLAIADRAFDQAMRLDDRAADAWYARGQTAQRRGRHADAREYFLAAKDRDQLRFRAPERFNEVVREVAGRHGATVADVQAALASAARHGVIDGDFMLEHVHPNLDGYFLLADAYFDALFASGVLVADGEVDDEARARREVPVSEVDRLFGEYKLQRVMNDWPFVNTPSEPAIPEPTNEIENLAYQMYHRRIGWPQAMAAQLQHYRTAGNVDEARRVAMILADALPFVPGPQFQAGTALIQARRAPEARRYLARAERASPNDPNVLLAHAHALILTGETDEARPRLQRVLQIDPTNATARDALAQLDRRGAPATR